MKTSEHNEQAALFHWAALHEDRYPELRLLFAIPNGGHRHPAVAAKLKKEGVKKGTWDVLLPVVAFGRPGLWIEMKVGSNKLTAEQEQFGAQVREQGYRTEVCYSWVEAAAAICSYLAIPYADAGLDTLADEAAAARADRTAWRGRKAA